MSAVVAMQTAASMSAVSADVHVETAPQRNVRIPDSDQNRTADTIDAVSAVEISVPSATFNITVNTKDTWTPAEARRYKELVAKEAVTGSLGFAEAKELNSLQAERFLSESVRDPEQIIATYRRQKVGFEMAQLLAKYVRIIPQRADKTAGESA